MANQDEEDIEQASFASEEQDDEDDDEYSYTYVDSDTEEQQQREHQLCGIKRNASPSFALNDNKTKEPPPLAIIKTTTTTITPATISRETTCPHCQEEAHQPVSSCELLATWQTKSSNPSLGVMVLKSKHVLPAMTLRIQECAQRLKISESQAFLKLRQYDWDVHVLLHTDGEEPLQQVDGVPNGTAAPPAAAAAAIVSSENVQEHDSDNDMNVMAMMMAVDDVEEDDTKMAAVQSTTTTRKATAFSATRDRARHARRRAAAGRRDEPRQGRFQASSSEAPHAIGNISSSTSRPHNPGRGPCRARNQEQQDEQQDLKPPALPVPAPLQPPPPPAAVQPQPQEAPAPEQQPQPQEAPADGEQVCPICMDEQEEQDMIAMSSCGHSFCRDCWLQFIQHMFDDAVLPEECLQTTCPMSSCETIVTDQEIRQVAPHLLPDYQSRQLHAFVEGNRTAFRWCAGPDCKDRVAVLCRTGLFPGRGNRSVAHCGGCDTQFCFRCGQAPHDDRYCEFEDRLSSDGKNKPVKNCPKCNIKIEKNGGCNHMHCKCGHHFCWICLADMFDYNHFCGREQDGHNDDEYARARRLQAARQAIAVAPLNLDYVCMALEKQLVPEDAEAARILCEKKEMDRIAHYRTRFDAHEQGQRFAENQCELLLEGRAIDFAKSTDLKSATDTDFLAVANERLVAARRMLKFTYAYAFFLPDEDEEGMVSQKGLFQNHQERLERFTEKLSEISEHALTYDDRANIVNLIGIIDQCMKAIIEFEEFGAKYAAPKQN